MRAPVLRTSAINAVWRGQSRMTTVRIAHLDTLGLGDGGQVVSGAPADVDRATRVGSHGDLVHVGVWSVQELPVLGDGDHGKRVGQPVRDQVGPLQWIDGDVELWRVARSVADRFADVEHRGLVALPFPDDDPPAQVNESKRLPHRLGGCPVSAVPIAASHEPSRRQRRRLGDSDHLESQVSIHEDIVALVAANG